MMPNVRAALMYLRALRLLKNTPAMLFGAYCWNPMAMEDIRRSLGDSVDIKEQITWQLRPTPEVEAKLFRAGQSLVDTITKAKSAKDSSKKVE